MSRIQSTFERLRAAGRPALMPYLTVGFPTLGVTVDAVVGLVEGGADVVELGVPFSDPLADGPTIQRASFIALENGVTIDFCFRTAQAIRERGIEAPLILMGYYNPIVRLGVDQFCCRAAEAGVDGLIVPDLPPDEAGELLPAAHDHGLDLIFLLAPTSDPARIERVVRDASGFIYCVSVTGVTGARSELPADLGDFIQRVRSATSLPVGVGFGVSQPSHFAQVAAVADGAFIGSAAVDRLEALEPSTAREGMREWASWIRSETR